MATEGNPTGTAGIQDLGFSQWSERAKLELQYLDKVGDLRVKLAKADNIDAQTGQQYATIAAKMIGIREAEQSLARLRAKRHQLEGQADSFALMGKHLGYFRLGDQAGRFLRQDMWTAWLMLLQYVPGEVLQRWGEMPVTISRDDLAGRTAIDNPCEVPTAPEGSVNFAAAMGWLFTNRYRCVAKLGSPIWLKIMEGLVLAAKSQADGIAAIRAEIEAMEKTTYDRVPPMELVKLTIGAAP